MNLTYKDIKSLFSACILLVLFLFVLTPGMKAQTSFIEMIGSSDVELMAYLENLPAQQTVVKTGDRIEITAKDLKVVYAIRRGKVISVKYQQLFNSSQASVDAYNKYMNYLYSRGVPLRQISNVDSCRVTRGYGGGIEANITVMPSQNKYRLDADLMLLR